MNKTLFVTLFLFTVTLPQMTYAATLIESKESNVGLQKTWIEGDRLRVTSEDGEQYMLMNFTQRTMHVVYPDKMQVMDMSNLIDSLSNDNNTRNNQVFTVEKKGKGPAVAGYQTDHYVVYHKGERCFESFTSLQAVKELDLEHFISGMNEMFPRENTPETNDNPCVNAENALEYEKIGIPLMLIEQDGSETYSISKFEKNAPLPAGGFSIPEGFTVIDYKQMVQQMMQPDHN